MKATAVAGANIAVIKYWGRTDAALNLPANDSLSLTLDGLTTTTTVAFSDDLRADTLSINGVPQAGKPLARAAGVMDRIRERAKTTLHARITSDNTFAAAAGLASSASAFAALPAAAFAALGVPMDARELSTYARLGSGSACRSVLGGWVEWRRAPRHEDSFAIQVAAPEHWDVRDVTLVFSDEEKAVKSTDGHTLADTSPYHPARVASVRDLLERAKRAIAQRDMAALGEVAESDALLMHAVMMTSTPSLVYWSAQTMDGIKRIRTWRAEGLPCYFTIDAGPNLHLLCEARHAEAVARRAREEFSLPAQRVLVNGPGRGVRVL